MARPVLRLTGAVVGRDAVSGLIHRVGDRSTKRERRDCDAGANDGEDERIFGRRSARFVVPEVHQNLHVRALLLWPRPTSPKPSCDPPP